MRGNPLSDSRRGVSLRRPLFQYRRTCQPQQNRDARQVDCAHCGDRAQNLRGLQFVLTQLHSPSLRQTRPGGFQLVGRIAALTRQPYRQPPGRGLCRQLGIQRQAVVHDKQAEGQRQRQK